MLHLGRLQPYLQALDKAEKACQNDKHSSLLQTFVNYGCKKFNDIVPRGQIYKNFVRDL